MTLLCGTEQGLYAEVTAHLSALVLRSTTPAGEQLGPRQVTMEPQALLAEARSGGFWSYAAGVAYQVLTRYSVHGLVVHNFRTDLPIRKGLSSSAAICVLIARAFNHIYGLGLSPRDEMELAYQGEITTPSRCGRMDQGCAFGRQPILMTFGGDDVNVTELKVGREVYLVLVNLCAQKDTNEILERLNRCYPVAAGEMEQGVQQLLGPVNRQIVSRAVDALAEGDAERLGRLMVEAQAAFDRYAVPACPEELAAPVLHRVLSYRALQRHVWGGKGVGSQGDGCAQLVARSRADQEVVINMVARDLGMIGLKLTIEPTGLDKF